MNWGWSLVLTFIVFGAFIGYLTVRSFQINVDLVTEDYYSQELAYQDRIEHTQNANRLEESVSISQDEQQLTVKFPDTVSRDVRGTINIFRPSDARFDFTADIALGADGNQQLNLAKLPKGYYKVQVAWATDAEHYYWEKPIFLR